MLARLSRITLGLWVAAGLAACQGESTEAPKQLVAPAAAAEEAPPAAAQAEKPAHQAANPGVPTGLPEGTLPPEAKTALAVFAQTPTPSNEEVLTMLIVWADVDVDIGPAPLSVTFSCELLEEGIKSPKYEWDFGDGSPKVSGASPTHTYAKPGTYTATVTVTDAEGNSGVDSVEVEVEDPEAG